MKGGLRRVFRDSMSPRVPSLLGVLARNTGFSTHFCCNEPEIFGDLDQTVSTGTVWSVIGVDPTVEEHRRAVYSS